MTRNETCTEEKIEIELGYLSYSTNTGTERFSKDLTCCIPSFSSLKNRCAMHRIGILDMNTLNKKLDKKISISVMQDLRMIANCIRQKLGVPDLIETGSSSSGTRVGLPLETDYIFRNPLAFESPEGLRSKVAAAMPDCLPATNDWTVLDITSHRVGVCVILVYENTIGVSFDIVPATAIDGKSVLLSCESKNTSRFLKRYEIDVTKSTIIKLCSENRDVEQDTGILENQILQRLEEGKKSGYRIAKYLIQNDICSKGRFHKWFGNNFIHLFGYAPILPSFFLRILFLRLLITTFDTKMYDQLSDGTLTLCLLVMLEQLSKQLIETNAQGNIVFYFCHPLLNYGNAKPFYLLLSPYEVKIFHERIRYVIYAYLQNAQRQDVSRYNLLNYPSVHRAPPNSPMSLFKYSNTMQTGKWYNNIIL